MTSIELTSFIRPQINSYWDIVLTWEAEKDKLQQKIEDLKDSSCNKELIKCRKELECSQKEVERYKDALKECEIKLRRCENRPPQYITQYVPQPVQYVTRYVTQYVTRYVAGPVRYVTQYVRQYVTQWRTQYVTKWRTEYVWRTEYITRWRTEYVTRWRTQYVSQPAYRAYNACWNYCRRWWWVDKHMNMCSLRSIKWVSFESKLVVYRQSQTPSLMFEKFIDQSVNLQKSFFPDSWKEKSLKRQKVPLLILHCKQVDSLNWRSWMLI